MKSINRRTAIKLTVAGAAALDSGVSVQEVSCPVLRERLLASKQRL